MKFAVWDLFIKDNARSEERSGRRSSVSSAKMYSEERAPGKTIGPALEMRSEKRENFNRKSARGFLNEGNLKEWRENGGVLGK